MKKIGFVSVFLLITNLLCLWQTNHYLYAETGLVGYWNFNETSGSIASDSSGNNLNGTIFGTINWISGKSGNCINFTNGSYINVPHNNILNLQNLTIALWVYPTMSTLNFTGLDTAMAFVSKRDQNAAQPYTFQIWRNAGQLSLEAHYQGVSTWEADCTPNNFIQLNQWQHLAVTREIVGSSVTVRFYLNGVKQYETGGNWGAATTNTLPLQISRDQYHASYTNQGTYQGKMDELRIYNRVLTQAEIQGDMGITGTIVSGAISTNTTWYYTNSPYYVTGNVAVESGKTLTIEPGVEVRFSTATLLRVDGTLIARGTAANKIVFTSNKSSATAAAGDWQHIKFTGSADDTKCIISYAEIKYAEDGIYVDHAGPTISYSTISYCSNYGIKCNYEGSLPSIDYFATITNNCITNNQNGTYSMGSPTISNNIIKNNTQRGIEVYSGGKAIISNNVVTNNYYGIYSYYHAPFISNNTISYNQEGVYLVTADGTILKRNNIINNLRGIYLNSDRISITRNNIVNNGTGIGIFSSQISTITFNNIYNVSLATGCLENRSNQNIVAANNWWGTTNTTDINNKIFDFSDDISFGKVFYIPFESQSVNILANTAPTLVYAGPPDYTNDGIHPETGDTNTNFVYKVKYYDTDNDPPAAGYPKVYIKKGGVNISGSPFTMSYESGTPESVTGAQYTYSTTLSLGTNYTYYFEAYDILNSVATGSPTTSKDAPDVNAVVPPTQSKDEVNVTVTQNLFNPARGQKAGIKFDLSSSVGVTITVFDILGNQVRSLAKKVSYSAGLVDIPWDGRNDDGEILPPGIYLVYIEIGNQKQVKQVAISAR